MKNEIKMFSVFSVSCGIIAGTIMYIFGGADILLKALVTLIIIDYCTGILKAGYNKKLNSTVGLKGIIKKVLILFIVATSVAIQKVVDMPIREVVVTFFIFNEGISILENAGTIIPIPDKLKNTLDKLNSFEKKNGD